MTTSAPVPDEQVALLARNEGLREALRRAASALNANGPAFALGGSYALWVYGAPEPVHDVDLVVAEPDTEAAAATLAEAGFRIERTPEDWLFKAFADNVLVDVLHRLNGVAVQPSDIAAADLRDVLAIRMPVLAPTEVLVEKLRSFGEHHCDFAKILPAVRAVRERIDWDHVRKATADNDFAAAFLLLADRLRLTTG